MLVFSGRGDRLCDLGVCEVYFTYLSNTSLLFVDGLTILAQWHKGLSPTFVRSTLILASFQLVF